MIQSFPMDALLTIVGFASVILVALVFGVLIIDLLNILRPRRVVIKDESGKVLGEISAEIVTKMGAARELELLSERVKQSGHVITSSTI
jgi:hypothetical protein